MPDKIMNNYNKNTYILVKRSNNKNTIKKIEQ